MPAKNLEDLFVDKLKDIYDAEKRITKALPKMAKSATSEALSSAFEEHLKVTEGQIERLDRIFESLDQSPGRKTCHGMVGLLEEGQEVMQEEMSEEVMDAALIAAAQEVEHYEIASYGTLRTWAQVLGKDEEAGLLQESLFEEEETDEKLNQLAESINAQAAKGEDEDEEEEGEEEMAGVGRSTKTTALRSSGGARAGGPRPSGGSRSTAVSRSSGGPRSSGKSRSR